MYAVHAKKKDDMTLVIPAPKGRLHWAGASQRHKDKRRTSKATARVKLRKEFDRG